MIARLPRGRSDIRLDLRGLRVRPLTPAAPATSDAVGDVIADALDRPLAGRPLVELARGRSDAVIVVPDATRRVDLPIVLPSILARLAEAGVPQESTTVLVACGTHPAAEPGDVAELVGPLPASVTVVQHDARDPKGLVERRAGTDAVWLHRIAADASLLVTVSSVRHHYFAGFGGGPKMLFPGVGRYEQIQANHARVMRRDGGRLVRDPRCEPGVLAGNPVAEEIVRLARVRPADAALCTVPSRDGRVAWAAFGDQDTAFDAAVGVARSWYEVASEGPFELMVVSAGGHPADDTVVQAHKALDAACRFLAPGGELLLVAALAGGGGSPDIEAFLRQPDADAIMARLEAGWIQYGHTVLRLLEKATRFRVWLDSDLDRDIATGLGLYPVEDPADVIARWRRDGPGRTVGVVMGAAVYPSTSGAPS